LGVEAGQHATLQGTLQDELGPDWGVDPDTLPLPIASLEYWIRVNHFALDAGRTMLGERFLVVNFDRLCAEPIAETQRLCDFLASFELKCAASEAAALIRTPRSQGRYRREPWPEIFSAEQIAAVRRLGLEV